MSEREEVCGHCGCTGGAIVQKGDLPKKYHATYADCCDALRSQLTEVERERENVSSQLWDCTNERDGYKHRAERMERVVEAADAFFDARTVSEEWECRSKMMVALTEYRALDAEAQP